MKYRKKPIEVEAIVFNGENFAMCKAWIGAENYDNTLNYPNIITSEGTMAVSVGDYIIKEPFDKERKFYPCKPDVFAATYEEVRRSRMPTADGETSKEQYEIRRNGDCVAIFTEGNASRYEQLPVSRDTVQREFAATIAKRGSDRNLEHWMLVIHKTV